MITTKKTDFLLPVCFVVCVSSSGTPEVSNTNQDSDFFHVFFVCLPSWLVLLHAETIAKKAQQHMFFLRQLKKFRVNKTILTQFYRAVIESVLTFSITV